MGAKSEEVSSINELEEALRAKKSKVTYVISIKTHSYQWLEGSAYWESPTLEIPKTKENEKALKLHKEGKAKTKTGSITLMSKVFKVGLIGCGHIAETYFRAHKYFKNFKIIKVQMLKKKQLRNVLKFIKLKQFR